MTVVLVGSMREFEIAEADLAPILGVSKAYISELNRGDRELAFDSLAYERSVLFVRVLDAIAATTGGASVHDMLYENFNALGGRPIRLMRTPRELHNVVHYFESFAH
ncbi:hypothetical protein [Salinisphaera hydrothermalis]|uniref:hypothetical protein n=1 Tax=Salinisphaera hydrothermalis TaxID=563188 RepID=UPI003341F517